MRTKFVYFIILIIAVMLFSCEKDEGLALSEVPVQAQLKLNELYPGATNVKWERYYSQYHVTFSRRIAFAQILDGELQENDSIVLEKTQSSAKFSNGGDWLLTKTAISYSSLPYQVVDSLRGSQFKNWVIQDQSLEDSPKFNDQMGKHSLGELFRLLMYDNTNVRPLYLTKNGEVVDKTQFK